MYDPTEPTGDVRFRFIAVQRHTWSHEPDCIMVRPGGGKIKGEGRFLLEGEEISCCSRVGIHEQLPSPTYYSIKCFR